MEVLNKIFFCINGYNTIPKLLKKCLVGLRISFIEHTNITGYNIISGNILELPLSFVFYSLCLFWLRKALNVGLCTTLTHGKLYQGLVLFMQESCFLSLWIIFSALRAIGHASCIVWSLIYYTQKDRDLPDDFDGHLKLMSVPKTAAFLVPVPSLDVASAGDYKTGLYC